jgi:prepilin-type N-terminal cleavage/methylation domain-containing protein
MRRHVDRGFTIIELLVVVSIIALLIGILLPAVSKARDQAKLTISQSNLRNLGTAHATYAAEFGDRQLTYTVDAIASYALNGNESSMLSNYGSENGVGHPNIQAGWGPYGTDTSQQAMWRYVLDVFDGGFGVHSWAINPIVMTGGASSLQGFGMFRMAHAHQGFNTYLSGRYYDQTFYAPKDTIPWEFVKPAFDAPFEFVPGDYTGGPQCWSSYCMSPAAMYSPDVFRSEAKGGFQQAQTLPAGYRSPAMSQALFPGLKTHMIEHHWLQNRRGECNPGFTGGTYDGCEPYFFNQGWASTPMTLFFDGHVAPLGVRQAEQADQRQLTQTGTDGLWHRGTPMGDIDSGGGYFMDLGYDYAETSYHILTTDGIRGRDTVSGN